MMCTRGAWFRCSCARGVGPYGEVRRSIDDLGSIGRESPYFNLGNLEPRLYRVASMTFTSTANKNDTPKASGQELVTVAKWEGDHHPSVTLGSWAIGSDDGMLFVVVFAHGTVCLLAAGLLRGSSDSARKRHGCRSSGHGTMPHLGTV
jgi:hypothetical protein